MNLHGLLVRIFDLAVRTSCVHCTFHHIGAQIRLPMEVFVFFGMVNSLVHGQHVTGHGLLGEHVPIAEIATVDHRGVR